VLGSRKDLAGDFRKHGLSGVKSLFREGGREGSGINVFQASSNVVDKKSLRKKEGVKERERRVRQKRRDLFWGREAASPKTKLKKFPYEKQGEVKKEGEAGPNFKEGRLKRDLLFLLLD